MKQTVSALLCILAIITGTNAQRPYLSTSFSFQGTVLVTPTFGSTVSTTTFTRFDVDIDTTRELYNANQEGITDGVPGSVYSLVSVNDNSAYQVLNSTCTESTLISNPSDPMNFLYNYWSQFDNAVENPPGTFTANYSQIVLTLVTVNGLPTSVISVYTSSSSAYLFVLTITSYTNSTPPFSTFTLPATCCQFTCTACYSSAVNLGSSFILMLLALVALAVMYSTV